MVLLLCQKLPCHAAVAQAAAEAADADAAVAAEDATSTPAELCCAACLQTRVTS